MGAWSEATGVGVWSGRVDRAHGVPQAVDLVGPPYRKTR